MTILVTGAWHCTLDEMREIESLCDRVIFMQNESDELPEGAEFVDGIICNGLFLYHSIEQFKNLKYIQLTSAGFDRVPMDYVKEHNVAIYNARGVYSIPMAEYAICGVLELYKHGREHLQNQSNKIWNKEQNVLELYGKTVCVVGCGSVGNEVAKRFSAFGCNVIGVDLFPKEDDTYDIIYPLGKINKALANSDVVVLTLPLTEETRHLINDKTIGMMKKGAVLVNIARGAIVDTNALICKLGTHLSGAVLDVFEEEPLYEESPLWKMQNVVVTPHNSFVGENNSKRLFDVILNNLKNAMA